MQPVQKVHRRVSPKREPRGVWTWRPDTLSERWDVWLGAHPKVKILVTVAGALIVGALLLVCATGEAAWR